MNSTGAFACPKDSGIIEIQFINLTTGSPHMASYIKTANYVHTFHR